ncbi:hypothetical protein NZD89_12315 [Alicyclobacillus fastidiosus]|uniref:Uncharacterized protein n=1 Tax=Alicyclobacillus fastidiosus TaxID=392011 RepID=A0ABY6ZMI0_9BACL|nr:hypothetical protein [Alicyclobacillus fastidiosus]WAH44089.1 hypothetical protein NZD89_12315 [Alicyclobacillus fastidiosus]GMA60382.1 hypothetical protein GCM10025859_08220 [Alicyclobacillus fastidiosus]
MDFPYDLVKEVHFVRRRIPLSVELRPMQKIAQILLVIHFSSYRNKSASILKLQIFNWAFKSPEFAASIHRLLQLSNKTDFPIIRFDPALNRAIGLALAEDYIVIQENTGKISIGSQGETFLASLLAEEELLQSEKQFLERIGKVSETAIENLFKMRFKINA